MFLLKKIVPLCICTFLVSNVAKSQVTVNILPDKDNYLSSAAPDVSGGTEVSVRTGRTGSNGGNAILRSLLHFDLSDIPEGSTINSATLNLFVDRVGPEATGVALHRLTANWGENEATWNHSFSPGTPWITKGGDFELTASAITGNVGPGILIIPDLASDVQSWVNNSSGNFGWILKGAGEVTTNSAKLIGSREQTTPGFRPFLSISYTPILNKAPAIILTTPANNATYLSGGNVYFTAAASDSDGAISKVEFYNGTTLLHTATDTPYTFKWQHVATGDYTLTAKATDNNGLATTSSPVHISVVPNKPPTVSIINPANNQTFLKGGTIHLEAAALDADGRITKVEFYNDTALLATERVLPYTFDWIKVQAGNYAITAKATDNWGAVTSSAVINVSVVPNKAPSVSIIQPANGASFTAPATINLEGAALDPDGRIIKVTFFNGAKVLATERIAPFTFAWQNVQEGSYTIIATAQDNWGEVTNSDSIIITVMPDTIPVNSRPFVVNSKIGVNATLNLKLAPNPASDMVNIYTTGLVRNKPTTLSVISASGVIIKTMRLAGSPTSPLNVSSLASGVYTIKLLSGDKVLYKKFVKL